MPFISKKDIQIFPYPKRYGLLIKKALGMN
jgi:hypothetical protein